jgi:hypothetical protein
MSRVLAVTKSVFLMEKPVPSVQGSASEWPIRTTSYA